MNPIIIELPLPPSCLSPNARAHWSKKHKATQDCRATAKLLGLKARPRKPYEAACYRLFFSLPRKIDYDNLAASCKAYLDGIQDAGIVVNDSELRPMGIERVIVGKDGRHFVRITIWPEFED